MGAETSKADDRSESQPSKNALQIESQNVKSTAKTTVNETKEVQVCEANESEKTAAVKLPWNWEAIVEDADSPIDKSSKEKLYDLLCSGVLLNQKRKRYWVEKKSGSNSFMLFARDLSITWAGDNRYWKWNPQEETSDVIVEEAELLNVCWLEVHARFDPQKLSPGILYEVVFVIMLKDPAYGWEVPVNLRLLCANGMKQERKENLRMKPRHQWIEIPVGEFTTSPEINGGDMEISMYEYEGGKWKRGLVIKGVIIRPKN